jgi:hypothetical protein
VPAQCLRPLFPEIRGADRHDLETARCQFDYSLDIQAQIANAWRSIQPTGIGGNAIQFHGETSIHAF